MGSTAALVPGSRLLDRPLHEIDLEPCLSMARDYDEVIPHTSTPSLKNDCRVAEAIKDQRPQTRQCFFQDCGVPTTASITCG